MALGAEAKVAVEALAEAVVAMARAAWVPEEAAALAVVEAVDAVGKVTGS
jgi:hypothetical protein